VEVVAFMEEAVASTAVVADSEAVVLCEAEEVSAVAALAVPAPTAEAAIEAIASEVPVPTVVERTVADLAAHLAERATTLLAAGPRVDLDRALVQAAVPRLVRVSQMATSTRLEAHAVRPVAWAARAPA